MINAGNERLSESMALEGQALRQQLAAAGDAAAALALASWLLRQGETAEAMHILAGYRADARCNARLRELHLGEGRNDAALATLRLVEHAPGSVGHWLRRGIEQHLAGDFQGAAIAHRQVLQLDRRHAAAANHLGRALHNLGQRPAALAAFQQAVQFDPDYAEAWHNLGHALRAAGALVEARGAFEKALALAPGYRSALINLGITLFSMDQARPALACFETLLARDPEDAVVLSHSALTLHLLGDVHEARRRYERALLIAPTLPSAHYYLGALCNELSDTDTARACLRRAIELNPGDADAWAELAAVEELSNHLDEAAAAVRSGLQVAPGHPQLSIEAAKLDRRGGDAAGGRDRLRALDPRGMPPRLQQQYFYELGNCLDRSHEPERAWQAFEQANALAASSIRALQLDRNLFFDEVRALDAQASLSGNAGSTASTLEKTAHGADLCFLIGFPRSGSTLLDTILDAHPEVVSIEEKPTLEVVIEHIRALPGGYPAALATLDFADLVTLRKLYREAIATHIGDQQPRIILDKLPMRGIHAALIRLLFPSARLLFVKRHPCDVVLSNFMQQYAVNKAYIHFYTVADSVRIYDAVLSLWRRLEPAVADRLHYLGYEALVANPGQEMDAVCRFLGIDWREEMLDARQRTQDRGRIHTNSYHQVSEPIYRRAVGRWQGYRAQLAPYLDVLRPHAEFLGYGIDQEA